MAAADKVVLQLPGSSSRISLKCMILSYTGREIQVLPTVGSAPKTYPADQVVEVHTSQKTPHKQGLQEFAEHQIDKAEISFSNALHAEPRTWVQREILAMMVRCAQQKADLPGAGSRFLTILKSDPDSQYFKLAPLVWSPEQVKSESKSIAKVWLSDNSEVARLMGASWLLSDQRFGDLAENKLKELRERSSDRVRQMARAQLWRVRLRASDLRKLELELWESRIRQMDSDLRGGPYYLMGRGHLKRQDDEAAAAAFLWVPMVYDFDYRLAARSCVEAADALRRIGQIKQATSLYREVIVRFPKSAYTQEAAGFLKLLQKSPNTDSN